MGVKVHTSIMGERVFPDARDWYVTDERVLQIYQEHDGDPEFVAIEYNREGWEAVEWDPPFPAPPPEPNEEDKKNGTQDAEGNRAEV